MKVSDCPILNHKFILIHTMHKNVGRLNGTHLVIKAFKKVLFIHITRDLKVKSLIQMNNPRWSVCVSQGVSPGQWSQ